MSPIRDLYTAVITCWLNRAGSTADISFLSHVQESKSQHNLPSRVPDWSCPLTVMPVLELALFRAAGDSQVIGEFLNSPVLPTLRVRGFLVLTV